MILTKSTRQLTKKFKSSLQSKMSSESAKLNDHSSQMSSKTKLSRLNELNERSITIKNFLIFIRSLLFNASKRCSSKTPKTSAQSSWSPILMCKLNAKARQIVKKPTK